MLRTKADRIRYVKKKPIAKSSFFLHDAKKPTRNPMTDPAPPSVSLVNPIPSQGHLLKPTKHYPGLFIVEPTPYSALKPVGNPQEVIPQEFVAAASIIQTFRVLSEAVLSYGAVFTPRLPKEPLREKPSLKVLQEFKGDLLKLEAEIKIAFGNKPPITFPKEFMQVFVQITTLLEQVEVLIQQAPPDEREPPAETPKAPLEVKQQIPTPPKENRQVPVGQPQVDTPQTPSPVREKELRLPSLGKEPEKPQIELPKLSVPLPEPKKAPPPMPNSPSPLNPVPVEAKEPPLRKDVEKPQLELPRPSVPFSAKPDQPSLPERPNPRSPEQPVFKETPMGPFPKAPLAQPPRQPSLPKEKAAVIENPKVLLQEKNPLEDLQKNIPILIQGLVKAMPQVPKPAADLTKQMEAFVRAPSIQVLVVPPPPLAKEANVPTFKGMPIDKPFIPNEILLPPKVLALEVPLIQKTYPNYFPTLPAKVPLPLNVPVPNIPLQRFPFEVPFVVGQKIVPHLEILMRTPPFSTEIPFAFIVPYTPQFPITTPTAEPVNLKKQISSEGEEDQIGEGELSIHLLTYVPDGETWYGDPFDEGAPDERPLRVLFLKRFGIGVYPVTNQQFVDFLNEQSKKGKIHLEDKGFIFSSDGQLLCQVKNGSIASDIEVEAHKRYLGFKAADSKESYPVICVTYHGAVAFCEAGGFRLPTEMEWEKAAAIQINEERKPVQKFRYGFSKDVIDVALANYGAKNVTEHSLDTQSTPVGFYNGKNIGMKEGHSFQTSNAVSPFGCYDMSGNLWEWTSTGEGGSRVVKGGCFQSSEKELRASARKWKKEESLDKFTGFRIALS